MNARWSYTHEHCCKYYATKSDLMTYERKGSFPFLVNNLGPYTQHASFYVNLAKEEF